MIGELALSKEQAAFLINVGLTTLVAAGTATVQDMTEAEFKAEILKQQDVADEETEDNSVVTPPALH